MSFIKKIFDNIHIQDKPSFIQNYIILISRIYLKIEM